MSTSTTSRSWVAAASIAAVEALKDQGFCRWNYTIRSSQQHVKNNVRSINSQAKQNMSSSSSAVVSSNRVREADEGMRKVMYLSCWGPY